MSRRKNSTDDETPEAPAEETAAAEEAQDVDTPVELRMLQNHFVAGVLKLKDGIITLPGSVARRELKLTKGIYSTDLSVTA